MVQRSRLKNKGYTLVEILIVISIVAIVVGLAIPSYQGSVRKARRSDAQTDLMEFAGFAERIYTQNESYAAVTLPANTDFYTYSFPAAVTATTYTIRATPTAVQIKDACGTMNLNQDDQRTHTGPLPDCW